MQVNEIKNEGLELQYNVVIPASKINELISTRLQNLAKTAKIQGFRPGKVPVKIVEQKYGAAVTQEVIEDQVQHQISHLIKDKNLKLATNAAVEDLKYNAGCDLEFVAKFEKMPEISMPNFSKISLEKPVVKVSEADVNEYLEVLASSKTDYKKSAKGKAELKDKLIIDFEGFLNGEAFEGGKGESFGLVLGSNTFIPGFEDQLVGAKADSEVTVKVTFPTDYQAKNLAGKETEFKVKVHEVQKPVKSEINDDFAKKLGSKSLDDLKLNIQQLIAKNFDEQIVTILKMKLFDKLEGVLKFEVPASLVKRETDALIAQVNQLKEEDPELAKKSDKELAEYYNKIALRRVRIGLLLAEYAAQKSIKVETEDLRSAVMNQARSFPGSEAQIFEFYQKNPKALQSLAGPILEDKAVKAIFDSEVKLSLKEHSVEELKKVIEEENNRSV